MLLTRRVGARAHEARMAFIDAELAKRLHGAEPTPDSDTSGAATGIARAEASVNRQPASLGKLHEVDLGPSSTLSNVARTEAARRRLETGEPAEEPPQRLGRDGKPWRGGRGRKRRTSSAVRRDKMVEEVLRESRLDLYDPSGSASAAPAQPADDAAAEDEDEDKDERVAEAFRREFLEAVSSRQRRRAAAPPSGSSGSRTGGAGKEKDADRPKGPKLGGSRSARAAMREAMVKAGKK